MKNTATLYVDQYGQKYFASNLKELRQKIRGRVSKMYIDGQDGKTWHIGYVIGKLWLNAYAPIIKPA